MNGDFTEQDPYDIAIDLYERVNGPPATPEAVQHLDGLATQTVQNKTPVVTRSYDIQIDDNRLPGSAWEIKTTTKEVSSMGKLLSGVIIEVQHSSDFYPFLSLGFNTTNDLTDVRYGLANNRNGLLVAQDALRTIAQATPAEHEYHPYINAIQKYMQETDYRKLAREAAHPAHLARPLVSARTERGVRERMFLHTFANKAGEKLQQIHVTKSQELYYLQDKKTPIERLAWLAISLTDYATGDTLYYSNKKGGAEVFTDFNLDDTVYDIEINDEQEQVMQHSIDALLPTFPRADQVDALTTAVQAATKKYK